METEIEGVGPIAPQERAVSLDALRGFALLGILVMNIQSFAMIDAAYLNPEAYGDLTGVNRLVWILSHLFADQKFISIFSMLFGAGIVLVSARAVARGYSAAAIHYRRTFWLLVIGLLHSYLLWDGDILVSYGLCALVVFLFRKLRPVPLLILGAVAFSVSSLIYAFFGWSIGFWPPEAIENTMAIWRPTTDAVAKELAAFRGPWTGQLAHRATSSITHQTFVFLIFTGWRAGGLMLVGMGLHKLGVFTGALSRRAYAAMAALGLAVGLPIIALGMSRNFAAGWAIEYSMFLGWQYNYWGSLFVALAYVGLVQLLCTLPRLRGPTGVLAAVGRMALTNYLLQTIVCTLIFFGHGLGLFGHLERGVQILIVFAVWAADAVFSVIWLRHFRFGPAEWLWRTLTYLKPQPMRL
jgi:uncharacterized protein